MATKGVHTRIAHTDGRGALCYSPDGQQILTAGADTFVKIFETANLNAEPRTLEHHDAAISTMAVNNKGTGFVTGTDQNMAQVFSYPEGDFQRIAVRTQSPIRAVAFDQKGRFLAVGDESGVIRMVLTNVWQSAPLRGHTDTVLCVAFDPTGDYLASSSADGTVRIWDIRDEPTAIKTFTVCGRVMPGSAQQLRLAWHPAGECLAVPRGSGVQLLERGTWEVQTELRKQHTSEVCHVSWSANGRYLCSAGLDKQIFLWDLSSGESIDRHKAPPPPPRPARTAPARACPA